MAAPRNLISVGRGYAIEVKDFEAVKAKLLDVVEKEENGEDAVVTRQMLASILEWAFFPNGTGPRGQYDGSEGKPFHVERYNSMRGN
jgi:hypothetical protein